MSRHEALGVRRKLVITGDGACGKTSLLSVFALGYFPKNYLPTVFDNFISDCYIDGKAVQMALWDTAGQEDYDRIRSFSYAAAHVILIAFSLDMPTSLENWNAEARHYCPRTPIILVGLKKDVRDHHQGLEKGSRVLNTEEGMKIARDIGARKYMECSALTGEGVDDVFEVAIRTALVTFNEEQPSSCCLVL